MEREKKIIRNGIIGAILNSSLAISKLIIGAITNSVAITIDGLNSLGDVLSSVVIIIGTKLAGKKADKEHPFGHGRIEYVTPAVVGLLILVAGIEAVREAVLKIINPMETNYSTVALMIILISTAAKLIYCVYTKRLGNQINSESLKTNAEDALTDALLSLSTFVAAIIAMRYQFYIEGYLGLIIALYIVKSSFKIFQKALDQIVGERPNKELISKIKKSINEYKEVIGTYDVILHNYGPNMYIGSVHVEVDEDMPAKEIHKLSKQIENKILKEYGTILTVGIYASNDDDKEALAIEKDLEDIVDKHDEVIQLHGFYANVKDKEVNFDLIIGFNVEDPEAVKRDIVKEIKKEYPQYEFYAIVDKDYSES